MAATQTRPGPRRVEAWIYSVVNPLCEALDLEASVAGLKNPTFLWRTKRLELLRPLRMHLTRPGVLIFDDLLRVRPGLRKLEREHDRLIDRTQAAARKAFDSLVSDEKFCTFVEAKFSNVTAPESRVPDTAEDLVNDRPETVGRTGLYEETWNRHLAELKRFRASRDFRLLAKSLDDLQEGVEEARGTLETLRNNLVDEYQLPPAPMAQ